MKLEYNVDYTINFQNQDPDIDAVFTDEAGEYIVEKRVLPIKADPFEFQLVIKRADRQPMRSWRVLQDIKNQIAGEDRIAVEIYPRESEVTDTANIYHLWVFRDGYGPTVSVGPPLTAT